MFIIIIIIIIFCVHPCHSSKHQHGFTCQARRFITLIDELYNHHCCLFCSAASSIDDLFQGTEEGTLFDLERQVVIILSLCSTPPDCLLVFSSVFVFLITSSSLLVLLHNQVLLHFCVIRRHILVMHIHFHFISQKKFQVIVLFCLPMKYYIGKDFEERWGLGLTSPTGEGDHWIASSFSMEVFLKVDIIDWDAFHDL